MSPRRCREAAVGFFDKDIAGPDDRERRGGVGHDRPPDAGRGHWPRCGGGGGLGYKPRQRAAAPFLSRGGQMAGTGFASLAL